MANEAVTYWHADTGGLYRFGVANGVWGEIWNFTQKAWVPNPQEGYQTFVDRQQATEVDQVDEAAMNAFVKQAPVKN